MTPSRRFALALIVVGVAAGIGFTLMTRQQQAPRATVPAAIEPAAGEFMPTIPNPAAAPGPAPEGMTWIPGGEFSMGAADPCGKDANVVGMQATEDSRPIHRVYVDGFWMDKTEDTDRQFAEFVEATGYVTVAERAPTAEEFPDAPPENLVAGSVVACTKLASPRTCRTHLEPLPDTKERAYHSLGSRLEKVEKDAPGNIICECELVTQNQIERAILYGNARTIHDIRRDTRLGMDPCQGGFCTFRTAGILHSLKHTDGRETNLALRDFLQERWKGLLPILWGSQLRQARLDQLIYSSLLNIEGLQLSPKRSFNIHDYEKSSSAVSAENLPGLTSTF